MKTYWSVGLLGLVFFLAACAGGQTRPAAGSSNGAGGSSLANSDWKGTYASGTSSNIPATLHIYSQNGSLMGTLTYDGYQETVAIATTTRGLQIKGVSYRDLQGSRKFFLDTFSAQVSADGRTLNATGGDTNSVVANQWLKLQRADSSGGGAAASQPASGAFVQSLIGSNWNGGIAAVQKGSNPAQMRIVRQNGAPVAIVTYDDFEEVMALSFTAPSGIQMRGTSVRDLSNQGRRFNLDTAQGQVSANGRQIQGRINGVSFDFNRVN